MRDADITVNALMEANDTLKLEMERHKIIETTLRHEKNCLGNEMQIMQSLLDDKEQECNAMEKHFLASLTEVKSLFLELEDMVRVFQGTFGEKFKLIQSILYWLKSQLQHSTHLVRFWLEEIWSEIIGKDCAVPVLHLCHMGILLERITGLNAENSLLYHGLCESNSVVAGLTEHNSKVKRELELCSVLKGKLLVDINNSFNRITKKENETAEFKARLNSFEENIASLQLQEESMLERSDLMGTELAILMKELDASNRNASAAASVQKKLLRENEELNCQLEKALKLVDEVQSINTMLTGLLYEESLQLISNSQSNSPMKLTDLDVNSMKLDEVVDFCKIVKCQNESVMTNMFAKDLELFVLASELRQKTMEFDLMVSETIELERQRNTFRGVIEKIKKEIVLHKLDMEFGNNEMLSLYIENEILNNEVAKLKEENSRAIGDLQEQKIRFVSSLEHTSNLDEENLELQHIIHSSEACITRLQAQVDRKCAELTLITEELEVKNEVNETGIKRIHALQMENDYLKNKLLELSQKNVLAESMGRSFHRLVDTGSQIVLLNDRMSQDIFEHKDRTFKFVYDLEVLELSVKELMLQSFTLQSELMRKEELSKGLSFDLRLLQESASVAKDQKDRLETVLESLQKELAEKCHLLDMANVHEELVEDQFLEKNERINVLESELAAKQSAASMFYSENLKLKADMEHILEVKHTIEEELIERSMVTERLEGELLEMRNLLGQKDHLLEELQEDVNKLLEERDHLDSQVLMLNEQMEMAQALAEEHEAIATEARQVTKTE